MVRKGRVLADPENSLNVVPPMAGSVVKVAVQLGQCEAAGSTKLHSKRWRWRLRSGLTVIVKSRPYI